MDLYVYYRVREGDAERLRPAVAAMQDGLAQRHGVHGQLKRRPETKDGEQTWMEVYPAAPDGFQPALDKAVAEAGLAACISGARHTEVFVDVTPCA
ncbi:DUF4936 family protein [Oxalobacteraceae bacterium A2-2]